METDLLKISERVENRRAWKKGEVKIKNRTTRKLTNREKYRARMSKAKASKPKKAKASKLTMVFKKKTFHYTLSRRFIKDIVSFEGNTLLNAVRTELKNVIDHPVITLEEEILFRNVLKSKTISVALPLIEDISRKIENGEHKEMTIEKQAQMLSKIVSIVNSLDKNLDLSPLEEKKRRIAKPIYDAKFEVVQEISEDK